jgi:hypothetical protein
MREARRSRRPPPPRCAFDAISTCELRIGARGDPETAITNSVTRKPRYRGRELVSPEVRLPQGSVSGVFDRGDDVPQDVR